MHTASEHIQGKAVSCVRRTRLAIASSCVICFALLRPGSLLADVSWNTTAVDALWTNTNNWTPPVVPGSGDIVFFTSSNITTTNINGDKTVKGVSFSGEANFTTNSTAGVLYVRDGGISVSGGNQVFNAQVRPQLDAMPVSNNGTGLLDFNGEFLIHRAAAGTTTATFSGSGNIEVYRFSRRTDAFNLNIVKEGPGTLTILNAYPTPANSTTTGYATGTTTINGGTISINAEANLGGNLDAFNAAGLLLNGGTLKATADFAIDDSNRGITLGSSGGTFEVDPTRTLTISNAMVGAGGLTKTGSGTLVLAAPNTYGGSTSIQAGTLRLATPPAAPGGAEAHWTFDDGTGADSSGNGHHGTLSGNANPTAGKVGLGAMNFNSGSVDVPYAASLGLNAFTVSAWVNVIGTPTNYGILGTRFGSDTTFDYKVRATDIHGDVGNGSAWISTAVDIRATDTGSNGQGGQIPPGTWHQITYVIDPAAGEFRLSLDGDLKRTITFSGTPLLMKSDQTLKIGNCSGTEYFIGRIDDVYLYGRALTQAEVVTLYRATAGYIPDNSAVSIASGATLDLNGNIETIGSLAGDSGSHVLLGAGSLITGGDNTTTTYSGDIAGTGGLVKEGTGTMTLAGTAPNTYSGLTAVVGGSLVLSKPAGVNAIAGNVIIGDTVSGDVLQLGASDQIADTAVLTFNSGSVSGTSAIFRLAGFNETVGGIMTGPGTASVIEAASGTSTLTVKNTADFTYRGIIRNNGGTLGLVKDGPGKLTLATGMNPNDYSGGTTIKAGTLSISSDSHLGSPSGALALDGGTLQVASGFTLSGSRPVSLQSGGGTIEVDPAQTLTVNNPISGAGSLTKSGAGTLVLGGASSYSGSTTVRTGALVVQQDAPAAKNGALGNSATPVALGASGTAAADNIALLTGGNVTLGRAILVGSQNASGTTTLGGAATQTVGSVFTGNVTLSRDVELTSDTTGGNVVEFRGTISGNGGITKVGSGVVQLSGDNSYTGSTTIQSGVLRLTPHDLPAVAPEAHWTFDDGTGTDNTGNGHNGTPSGGVTAVAGKVGPGALSFNTGYLQVPYAASLGLNSYTVSAWVNVNNTPGVYGILGTRFNSDMTFDYKVQATNVHGDIGSGSAWINTGVDINAGDTGTNGQGGQLTPGNWYMVTYAIDGAAGQARLSIDGELKRTLTFSGTPLLMKPDQVMRIGDSSGTEYMFGKIDDVYIYPVALDPSQVRALYLGSTRPNYIPDASAVSIAPGATLDLNGVNETVGSLAGGSGSFVTLGSGTLTTGGNGGSTVFAGEISGSGGLVKEGSGSLTLSGANSYLGPTVLNAGALIVNGSTASDTTVNGGLLGGSGTLGGNVTVNPLGTLSAGNTADPTGHLRITGDYDQTGTLLAQLGGTGQGSSYDWIEVDGTATLAGTVQVSLVDSFSPSLGDVFDILTAAGGITNADLSGVLFDFSGAPSANPWVASIVSLGGTAEALRLSATPEPGSVLLMVLGGLALAGWRCRRNSLG